jgi:hypothetical protein
MNGNITQLSKNKRNIFKQAVLQYKLDLSYVKNISNQWKQKPYRFILTELSIAKHSFYWRIIKKLF